MKQLEIILLILDIGDKKFSSNSFWELSIKYLANKLHQHHEECEMLKAFKKEKV